MVGSGPIPIQITCIVTAVGVDTVEDVVDSGKRWQGTASHKSCLIVHCGCACKLQKLEIALKMVMGKEGYWMHYSLSQYDLTAMA